MTTLTSVQERLTEVQGRIADAAAKAGRGPNDVLLVAVTKYAEPEQIRELLHHGHRDFGESRVQQLVQRAAMVEEYLGRLRTAPGVAAAHDASTQGAPDSARWHMIGRLQRNKVKKAVEHSRLIHSIDSLRLAEEVQTIALRKDVGVDILLQVNSSGETVKQGVAIPAAIHVAEQIGTMVNVNLRGMMTMAPLNVNESELRLIFERTRECFDEIRSAGVAGEEFNILSMGMSGDFELAIEHGANMVRIGSAIFGDGPADGEPDEGEDDD